MEASGSSYLRPQSLLRVKRQRWMRRHAASQHAVRAKQIYQDETPPIRRPAASWISAQVSEKEATKMNLCCSFPLSANATYLSSNSSFYFPNMTIEEREAATNYLMTLNTSHIIDLTTEMSNVVKYRSSLGHKVMKWKCIKVKKGLKKCLPTFA